MWRIQSNGSPEKERLSQVTCAELITVEGSGLLLFSLGFFLQKYFPLRSEMGTLPIQAPYPLLSLPSWASLQPVLTLEGRKKFSSTLLSSLAGLIIKLTYDRLTGEKQIELHLYEGSLRK